jgi:sulfur carrier protein ThiS adenylyltransferase
MADSLRDDLLKKLGARKLSKIEQTVIGLAGVGGLGSNCAMNLVRSGFRRLVIVDFDVVELINLDRQFYFADQVGMIKVEALSVNLKRIAPDIEIIAINKKIQEEDVVHLFSGCDAVVECLDRAESKRMIVSMLLPTKRFIVSASGLGGFGHSDDIKATKLKHNLVLVGDYKSDIANSPALSPRVSIAAAKQADVVLEFIAGEV